MTVMNPIGLADKVILSRFRASGAFEAQDVQLNFLGNAEMGGSERAAINLLRSLDAKVAPLLAHVSIMIAALVILLATAPIDRWKQYLVAAEIALYIIVAMGCLRCIHSTAPNKHGFPKYQSSADRRSLFEEVQAELAIKISVFEFVNQMAIYLTAFLLISTPPILAI